ncbi:SDR family oxidoreductase [Actinocrinis puniceicyclus]|uniref:SDR family oxidoreductase n=1 Tax=Actinocrinis puniceicyclus TaxID=977794 RepID=A0A8J7WS39_9ACTN|nr:SDR family oxidoreductase [Actinocrinis puniceicyclus]MBS2965690.1 SDR family oxidoreductase [Actinocrinis puniceicyclus]
MNRFDGATALVTGASRGLGFAIAGELARRGARLLICARDPAALDQAAWKLHDQGAEVYAIPCDVTDENAAERLIAEAQTHYGRLDVLVNNAGVIQVGPLASMQEADFRTAMETMFFAPLRLVLAAAPIMRAGGGGTIVNISSLGGRIAAPHLLPYDCAKFALAGLSTGLRAELAADHISVTTVVPGLMRTGSHLGAQFRGNTPREYAWFAAAAGLPLLSIDAERAARAVVRAAERRRPEIILGAAAHVAVRMQGLAPATTTRLLTLAARVLRTAAQTGQQDGFGVDREAGAGSASHTDVGSHAAKLLDSRVVGAVTALNDRAARRLNQVRHGAAS